MTKKTFYWITCYVNEIWPVYFKLQKKKKVKNSAKSATWTLTPRPLEFAKN